MEKENKEWFGKRWTKNAVNYLDALIFGSRADVNQISMASSFCGNFTLGLIGGFVFAVLTLFYNQDDLNTVVTPAIFALSLMASIWLLWNTLGCFNSIWTKIGRSLYVVVFNFIACGFGVFIGVWLAFVVIALLVLWLVLKIWLGDSGKSKTVTLDDGTELHNTKGVCGEDYWSDSSGTPYRETGNGQFKKG